MASFQPASATLAQLGPSATMWHWIHITAHVKRDTPALTAKQVGSKFKPSTKAMNLAIRGDIKWALRHLSALVFRLFVQQFCSSWHLTKRQRSASLDILGKYTASSVSKRDRCLGNICRIFQSMTLFADIDECLSFPCKSGGNCTNLEARYNCSCSDGWDGTNCQTGTSCTWQRNLPTLLRRAG